MDASLVDINSRRGSDNDSSLRIVEVKVEGAADLDEALNDAVELMLKAATEQKTGIMVTRMGVGRYVVQAHPEVAVGLIRQRHI